MNSEDAKALGIKNGERIRVKSRRGEITSEARVSEKTSPGEVWMPFHFPDGDANWLTNSALDKFARIPEYKVCACRLEKIPDSEAYDENGNYITQAMVAAQVQEEMRKTVENLMPEA